MQKTLTLLAAASAAVILGAPATQATPAARAALDGGAEPAHSVRICDDDGDCWWSGRHHGRRYWDEGRHWRHGWRDRDDDYYGRGDRRRDWDRDDDRYERRGYKGDRDDWGRSDGRERYGRDVDRDRRGREETTRDQATKEHGGVQNPATGADNK